MGFACIISLGGEKRLGRLNYSTANQQSCWPVVGKPQFLLPLSLNLATHSRSHADIRKILITITGLL